MPIKDKEAYNAYMREYLAERYEKRRNKFLEQLGNKCACGSNTNLYFVPTESADKKFDFAKRLNGAPMKKLQEQLAHHFLQCASCRAKVRNGVEHGGGVSGVRNCKCELCKAKKNEYMLEYMRKKRQAEK